MELRWLALVLLVGVSGTFGLLGARRLEWRVQELQELRLALQRLDEQIHYLHSPLPLALEYCGRHSAEPVREWLLQLAAELQSRPGIRLDNAWRSSLRDLQQHSHLQAAELDILRQMATRLGASGVNEQQQLFAWVDTALAHQQAAAEAKCGSGRKLWSYGGFIVGAALALLLL